MIPEQETMELSTKPDQDSQTLLLRLMQGQRKTDDPEAMMAAAAEAVGTFLHAGRAGFFETRDGDLLDFRQGWTAGRFPLLAGTYPATAIGIHSASNGTGRPTEDSGLHNVGPVSTIQSPLIRNGLWHAGLYVQDVGPRVWAPDEITFVRDASDQTWDAVERARAVARLRASEVRFRFLSGLDDATRPLTSPDEITQAAAHLLGEHLHVNRCAYADVEDDADTFNLTGDYNRGVQSIIGRYAFGQFGGECLRLMREGAPFVVVDSETDPRTAEALPAYRLTSIRSVVCVPLHKSGRLVAAMAVHQTEPREWSADEIELLLLVAGRCWESLERARITRELQTSERRLRLSQRASRSGTFEWFMKEDRIIWTPELEALYGMPEGAFRGGVSAWAERVVVTDAELVQTIIQNAVARRDPECSYEFRAVLPDGTLRWLYGQAQFTYDEAGAADRMIGINIDIAARKQAEDHLYQQWHTFDTVLSNVPDHVYAFDLQGRFTYANAAVLALFQKSLDELLGKSILDLDLPAEAAGMFLNQVRRVIETKQSFRSHTPLTLPSGEIRHYEYIYVPVLSADGRVETVTGTTRDITERRRAEEQERIRQEQMRESARLESLGVMAGGIAHDFNNLLTGILGNASLLATSDRVSTNDLAVARDIVLGAERAADLTRQMLAFAGKGRFIMEVLEFNTLVQENLTLLRASLSRNVSVELDLWCEGCCIEGDRGQMQQLIMNLLINASEAVGEHPGYVLLRTALVQREAAQFSSALQSSVAAGLYVELEVRDNGSGMSLETLKKIFDPFFTTKFTGRGIGLAAVLGIVKGHHGDIEVSSELGVGTRFRVHLPATRERPVVAPPPIPAAAGENRAVLVVDDEEIVRRVAIAALTKARYRVLTANNGEEALEVLRENPDVALVILDITMPVMTGEQALPLIKELYPALPIILCSGYSEMEVARRFASSGIAGVLQKPYTVTSIAAKTAQALQAKQ